MTDDRSRLGIESDLQQIKLAIGAVVVLLLASLFWLLSR
jgi:hypothetical protein